MNLPIALRLSSDRVRRTYLARSPVRIRLPERQGGAFASMWRVLVLLLTIASRGGALDYYLPSEDLPPAPTREFRGAWVATVNNIDWPSRPGLSSSQQQQELLTLLNQAVKLKLNAILFQVRPACDALYESSMEPWSEYLSGTMGKRPEPAYDPLAFIIREAHVRGLELHAWFNPFRARHQVTQGAASARHISRTKPQWVRSYGRYLWLDPTEPGVQDYSLRVILDVVKRYDIDGVHLDDYFYPYKEKDAKGKLIDFPDGASWKRYLNQGGRLARDDWRRSQVDLFVRKLYQAVKAQKPYVKVGISPFGIWRPGNPPGIDGLDAFQDLYADSRKWWSQGWVDYLAPQLYWSIDSKAQSFPVLLKWWSDQNIQRRHLYPGLATANIGTRYASGEIVNQVRLSQKSSGTAGHLHWSVKALLQNRQGIGDMLASGPYAQPALVPACSWIESRPPPPPELAAMAPAGTASAGFSWRSKTAETIQSWLVQYREKGQWRSQVFSGQVLSCLFPAGEIPDAISVRGMDRCGNLSIPTVLGRRSDPSPSARPSSSSGSPEPRLGPPARSVDPTPPPSSVPRDRSPHSSDRRSLNGGRP